MPCVSASQSITKPAAIGGNLLGVSARRLPELDTLRGFLLVWMTLTHLPTRVSAYSNQIVGYVSAAEGFILLAAILVGRIQQSGQEKYGASAAREKLWRRVGRIYGYHLALLAFAFSIGAIAAGYFHRLPLQNLLDYDLQHPIAALIAAPALLYNPPLLDILPMYIVFMLLTPLLMWTAERWGWRLVLPVSGSVWVLAQFGLRAWMYTAVAHVGFPIPLNETGAFDPFGWQLLWTAGLFLGGAKAASLFSKIRIPKYLVIGSAAVAVILLICRHTAFDALTGPALFDVLVNKWRLGIFRLVDAAALGVLLVKFGTPLARTRLGLRLATLGQASLEVFSAHVVFCFLFLAIGAGPDASAAWWQDAIVLIVTIAALFIVADHAVKRRRREGASPRTFLVSLDLCGSALRIAR